MLSLSPWETRNLEQFLRAYEYKYLPEFFFRHTTIPNRSQRLYTPNTTPNRHRAKIGTEAQDAEMISAILLVIITIFLPPVGVYCVAGCGADLLINLCLTLLGFLPGHIHAFYLEYVYYKKKEESAQGYYDSRPAPGVYSDNVNTGGRGYGTMG